MVGLPNPQGDSREGNRADAEPARTGFFPDGIEGPLPGGRPLLIGDKTLDAELNTVRGLFRATDWSQLDDALSATKSNVLTSNSIQALGNQAFDSLQSIVVALMFQEQGQAFFRKDLDEREKEIACTLDALRSLSSAFKSDTPHAGLSASREALDQIVTSLGRITNAVTERARKVAVG